jgi:S-adenosylmethionine synthetase
MVTGNKIVTSESVTEGHPDKVCDMISDAIVDACIAQDPMSRVGCDVLVKAKKDYYSESLVSHVKIGGEITSNADIPGFGFDEIIRNTIKDIGYDADWKGFNYKTCIIERMLTNQSPDISLGVTETCNREQGAGDQGMMYGYACKDTAQLMPLPIELAHDLTYALTFARKSNTIRGLGPDGKSQVSVEYENGRPLRLDAIVIAQQHHVDIDELFLKDAIRKHVIIPQCRNWIDEDTKIYVNATGRFVVGGPEGDSGVTGRKIIVDTYGGVGRHGGGAFSGKDPSKVDRSGAYMARYIAKNIVAADLANECEVQISYAIGVAEPTSVYVDCFGTNKVDEERISSAVMSVFDMRPKAIIENLGLRKPIYKITASGGHFGREPNGDFFSWEKLDKVNPLRRYLDLPTNW